MRFSELNEDQNDRNQRRQQQELDSKRFRVLARVRQGAMADVENWDRPLKLSELFRTINDFTRETLNLAQNEGKVEWDEGQDVIRWTDEGPAKQHKGELAAYKRDPKGFTSGT